ncbi:hypothetical protein [Microbacterium sp. EST19A]|uniref:hypothetical protein n=1 Tax=Microbacterium sp. EST19A TaxID=2862681 RepID=UPI001CBF2D5E|nr:hypothetical protein [Microbacterium sp. EST19A]
MRVDERLGRISNDLDYAVRNGAFADVPVKGESYAKWYARLLSTLTLIVGDMKVLYSQTTYDPAEPGNHARTVLFTGSRVIVVDIADVLQDDTEVRTRILPRKSLEAIDVAAGMRIDTRGSESYGWPGELTITAHYPGLDGSVKISGPGVESYKVDQPAPIMALLETMQNDLTA